MKKKKEVREYDWKRPTASINWPEMEGELVRISITHVGATMCGVYGRVMKYYPGSGRLVDTKEDVLLQRYERRLK